MLALLLSLCASLQTSVGAQAPNPAPQASAGWDALASEYEHAFEQWGAELSRSGGWEKPENERTPHPARAFWARFEALAAGGEGRAVLWQLDNASSAGQAQLDVRRRLFERVRAGGEAEWVVQALPRLASEGLEADVRAHLASLQGEARPKALRVVARLVEANLAQAKEAGRAADLRLRAAMVEYHDVELAAGEALAPADRDELASAVIDGLAKAQEHAFEQAYFEGSDGVYYPRAAAPTDPLELWQPVVETLADRGCPRARYWSLFHAGWQLSDAEKERQRGFLAAVAEEPVPEEWQKGLGYEVGGWIARLGQDFVEPRVRKLIESSAEDARPAMFLGLGEALCEAAQDEPGREKGLALLREVAERWPTSDAAKRAAGKLFRFTNLVVGKTAPDFETVDVDGNAFKLSDYKGKVTVVDFWGFW